jgi:excisionase family DNA binding protein
MSTAPEPWLTVAQAAARLSLSTKALYNLVAPGCDDRKRIPCYRLGPMGGAIRFRASDLDAWVESRRDAPKAAKGEYQILRPKPMPAPKRA